jgi:outer membrane protein assembly factor BamB
VKQLLFVILSLAAAGSALADPWPQFRGPNGQGRSAESGFPLHWSATENIAWQTTIPGEAWSSPIVWGDFVFVTTATDNGTVCRVVALDRKSGDIVWNTEVFRQATKRKEGRNTYATPTPATDGKHVYACFGDGSFVALDFQGQIAWINRDYPFYSQHGLGTALLIHDGLLIMARDGSNEGDDKNLGWQTPWDQSYVLALDTQTGKERWKSGRGFSRISHGTPAIWMAPDGQAQVISEAGDVVQGFDLKSGKRLWTSLVAGEGKVPSVVLAADRVFTSGGWGGKETIKAFRLGPTGDLVETNLLWEQKKGMPKIPSMLYIEPHLYALTDSGIASCYDASSGEIIWQERIGGNYAASPVEAEGHIYLMSDTGDTTIVAAAPEFQVVAKNTLPGKIQATPALSQGQIFVRTETEVIAIGGK